MNIIKNNHPLSAETLFNILKKEFADYINQKLDANLSIEYAHVYDIINISFPEVIEGTVFTITVTDDDLTVSINATDSEYNIELLEQHLMAFLEDKCS
jgi:hypothetical protein